MDDRHIKCPYCKQTFTITEEEQYGNETFECPHCHLANAGCSEVDELGVLVGVSILDYELQELLRDLAVRGDRDNGKNNKTNSKSGS